MSELSICVPATSANLGPGFDMFGLALNMHTRYRFTFSEDTPPGTTTLLDADGNDLGIPDESNLIAVAYRRVRARAAGLAWVSPAVAAEEPGPGWSVRVDNDAPVGRGFGSSASALVAGVAAGRFSLGLDVYAEPVADVELLNELEGHPDNVAPARLGGFVIGFTQSDGRLATIRKRLSENLGLAVIFPDFNISTKTSRGRLPEQIPIRDCLTAMKGVLLWREFLEDGDPHHLIEALRSDRLHEPYRGEDIPGFRVLRAAARDLGLYGVTISGSGPSLLAYFDRQREAEVLTALRDFLSRECPDQALEVRPCRVDEHGLRELADADQYSTGRRDTGRF